MTIFYSDGRIDEVRRETDASTLNITSNTIHRTEAALTTSNDHEFDLFPIALRSRPAYVLALMSERPQTTVTLNGREIRLVGTHPEYLAAFTDLSAHPLAGIVRRYLPHGAMIFDVGANIGVVALVMALTRPDCQVVAFEPLPTSCDCLRINLEANAVENVRVINAAVSDAPGELRLADNGPWSPVHEGAPIRAAAIRLNDLAAPPPSLIKIDAEGWEPHVLAGASRVLETRPLVFLEFSVWTLLVQHYDPLVFAEVLYRYCDMMAAYAHGGRIAMPRDARCLVHANMMEHGCQTDLLLRPRAPLPDLQAMTKA